jgi:glycine hydroxymethyltransferase
MTSNFVQDYLGKDPKNSTNTEMIGYIANLQVMSAVTPEIAGSIVQELIDQRNNLKLIASENYSSLSTQLAMGNLLTDKYAEGFPNHRFYAGCDNVDSIEAVAAQEACDLFGAEHAYVQPHSGADANLVAYWGILSYRIQKPFMEQLGKKNLYDMEKSDWDRLRAEFGSQKLLGMDYYSGGHLTHGYRYNISSQIFDAYNYGVSKETGLLDYDELETMAKEIKPLILLVGYSAYPRKINFRKIRQIADSVGATMMVDMAHFAGLVAAGIFSDDYNPVKHAHVVTSTTHKTLRGPRGGLVLSTAEYGEYMDKGCPMILGGPLPHVMAAKAVAFKEANSESFKKYAQGIVDNSTELAKAIIEEGIEIATGGTDNHLMLLDVRPFGVNGRQAESAIRECGITLNRNSLPYDPNGAWYTSGLRIGTPAVTTLGMGKAEMREIASIMKLILTNIKPGTKKDGTPSKASFVLDDKARKEALDRVHSLLGNYPVYPELDTDILADYFIK